MRSAVPLALIVLSSVAFAHGGEKHLRGEVAAIDEKSLTLTTEAHQAVTVSLDEATQFDKEGKASSARELTVGSRAVVHLRAGAKTPTAALVKFAAAAPTPLRLEVKVTDAGFTVEHSHALKVNQPVTLMVTRTVDGTCAKDIVLKEFGISKPLPLNTPVEVSFVPRKVGKVHFSCAMGMVSGDLTVE